MKKYKIPYNMYVIFFLRYILNDIKDKFYICIHFIIRTLGKASCIIKHCSLILRNSLGFPGTLNRYQGISLFEQDQGL